MNRNLRLNSNELFIIQTDFIYPSTKKLEEYLTRMFPTTLSCVGERFKGEILERSAPIKKNNITKLTSLINDIFSQNTEITLYVDPRFKTQYIYKENGVEYKVFEKGISMRYAEKIKDALESRTNKVVSIMNYH